MAVGLQEFYISPEFVEQTDQHLAQLKPYTDRSPANFSTDFLGVHTDVKFYEMLNPSMVENARAEQSMTDRRPPTVKNGEQYFELGSLVAAINDCRGRFVMAELGGGWGARVVSAHAMVQKIKPIDEFYILVEAMGNHCEWIAEHMSRNSMNPKDHSIIHAAVWTDNSPKLFPVCTGVMGQSLKTSVPQMVSDMSPVDAKVALMNVIRTGSIGFEEDHKSRFAEFKRGWAFVSSVTMRDLFLPVDVVDYVDMDIQGAELEVITHGMDILRQKVRRMHIGTHGAEIHDNLLKQFRESNWDVVVHIPPAGQYQCEWGSFSSFDGILSVVNKELS